MFWPRIEPTLKWMVNAWAGYSSSKVLDVGTGHVGDGRELRSTCWIADRLIVLS